MKKCPVCGHANPVGSQFCESCGNQLRYNLNISDVYQNLRKDIADTLSGRREKVNQSGHEEVDSAAQGANDNLIAPDETVQATIGVNYIQNLLSGEGFKNGAAILTDKRLYYFGRSFSNIGKGMDTTTEEGVISVDEIIFTRFVHGSPLSRLIAAIVSFVLAMIFFVSIVDSTDSSAEIVSLMILILLPIGVAFLVAYFAGKSTVLEIAFPGGKYCFNARWHSTPNMREFQRQIHLIKDSLKAGQNNDKNEKAKDSQ